MCVCVVINYLGTLKVLTRQFLKVGVLFHNVLNIKSTVQGNTYSSTVVQRCNIIIVVMVYK